MSQELFYTSVPRGLKPGTKGFCSVAMTDGMSASLVERLESLSGYRPLYPAGDAQSAQNPLLYAHWRISASGRTSSVLSRVCFAGSDYTGRSNKFAHHLVLSNGEQAVAGPAWLMMQPGVMETQWSGEPRLMAAGRPIPKGDDPPRVCGAWAAATGDAGWGGVLAEAFANNPSSTSYVVYPPGTDVLLLLAEAIGLLPHEQRWRVTFNTYFTDLPAGLTCAWRCCVAGTPAAKEALRSRGSDVVIDLAAPLNPPEETPFVRCARLGYVPQATQEEGSPAEWGTQELAAASQPAARNTPEPIALAGAAPTPSRARLSSLATVNQGDDEADQSWMPPFDATIVERESSRGPRIGNIHPAYWIVAIVWPVVVAAIVWLTWQQPQFSSTTDTPAKNATRRNYEQENADLKTKVETLQQKLRDSIPNLEAAKVRLNDLGWWSPESHQTKVDEAKREGQAHPEDTRFISIDKYKERADECAKLKIALADANKRMQPSSGNQTAPVQVAAPIGPPIFMNFQTLDPRESSWPVKGIPQAFKASGLTFDVPSGIKSKYFLGRDGVTLRRPKAGALETNPKEEDTVAVGRFTLLDGNVAFEWLLKDRPEELQSREFRDFLQFSSLTILSDGTGARQTVQFQKVEDILLKPEDTAFPLKRVASLPDALQKQIRVRVDYLPTPWAVREIPGDAMVREVVHSLSPKASFQIACHDDKSNWYFQSSWAQGRRHAQEQEQASRATREDRGKKLEVKDLNKDDRTKYEKEMLEAKINEDEAGATVKAYEASIELMRVSIGLDNGFRFYVITIKKGN